MTAAEDSATGGVDPVEEAGLTGVVAAVVDLVTVDLHATVTKEVVQEIVEASAEDTRTAEGSRIEEDSRNEEETGTLIGAHLVVATRPGVDLPETGGQGTLKSSGSPHQKSCPSGPG